MQTKILMCQDIHVSPNWIEESKRDIDKIACTAKEQNVDAICIAGDFFHKAVMATDNHNWNEILNLARKLQDAAQVYFIHGTPSHDVPGCYSSFIDIGWKEIGMGKSEQINDVLIMGIQEISPSVLMSKFPDLSKTEIIAKQYELVNSLIDSYYIPLAVSHHDPVQGGKYVHFMGHGHISGSKFRDDQSPRTTDFMYPEKMLSRIDADFYQFGHIHLPQDFKSIRGGYGGSAHITWNDLNFQAGFNIVTYSGGRGNVGLERFNYDKPIRKKIVVEDLESLLNIKLDEYENSDLWVNIKCDKEFADNWDCKQELAKLKSKISLGENSKITTEIQHIEHTRISTDEYNKCLGLEDLYKLYRPEVKESILKKVNEAENAVGTGKTNNTEQHIELLELYLRGTKAGLENGCEETKIDFTDFNTGANLLVGPNGIGKSFILGFCTPFSVHLPRETDLKLLFSLKESQVYRKFKVGDDIIEQRILIDPTLKNPSAKYSMSINGEAIAGVTGTKAPFDSAVFDLFGDIRMFFATVFRGQKENKNYPGLENAKESDLRQIFTSLLGVDRTPLKEYAHEKVKVLKNDIAMDEREMETLLSIVEGPAELKQEKTRLDDVLKSHETKLSEDEKTKYGFEADLKIQNDIIDHNKIHDDNVIRLQSEIKTLKGEMVESNPDLIEIFERQLKNGKMIFDRRNELNVNINDFNSLYIKSNEDYQTKKTDIEDELKVIETEGTELKHDITYSNNIIDKLTAENIASEEKIDILTKPCDHCGKLSIENENDINKINLHISNNTAAIIKTKEQIGFHEADKKALGIKWSELNKTIPSKPEKSEEHLKAVDDFEDLDDITFVDIQMRQKKVDTLNNAVSTNKTIQDQINSKLTEVASNITSLKDFDRTKYDDLENRLSDIISAITEKSENIISTKKDLEFQTEKIQKNNTTLEKITSIKNRCAVIISDISEWEEVEKAFSPKGIPALELSLIAPQVNSEANTLLNVYGTRFSIEIITQDLDSKNNLAEKFKILVHDSYSSDIKNLSDMSGGQAAWITKSLQESISKIYSSRSGRTWLYSIMDEADGALDSNIISKFYEMMDKALDGKRKLISVSHSPDAKEAVQTVIDVTEFYIDYKGE